MRQNNRSTKHPEDAMRFYRYNPLTKPTACQKSDHLPKVDVIDPVQFSTITALFRERVRRSPEKTAYRQFDSQKQCWKPYSWLEMSQLCDIWIAAFSRESLPAGSRVLVQMANSIEWILVDQAALACELVVVPVFVEDRSDNVAYIIQHAESEVIFVSHYNQWQALKDGDAEFPFLKRVVILDGKTLCGSSDDPRVLSLDSWLGIGSDKHIKENSLVSLDANQLATIVYTSGTTGKPKGVMLSHANMLGNAFAGLQSIAVFPEDRFLSFLPLSHMFERTVGYYLTIMCGAEVVFNRSISELSDDIAYSNPSVLVSVPRIFERVQGRIMAAVEQGSGFTKWLFNFTVDVGWQCFQYRQKRSPWKAKQLIWPLLDILVARKIRNGLGGNLRLAVCGGAKLSPKISRMFLGLGVDILQGYGMTESSPVISVNTLSQNQPESVGMAYHGVELKLSEEGELLSRSPYTMRGYWKNPKATADVINVDGWLSTGDIAKIDDEGFVYITGRIKEIIVLANGEKVPPADMESAIVDDPLFEQAMVVGEGQPYLTALLVLNRHSWLQLAEKLELSQEQSKGLNSDQVSVYLLDRIANLLSAFPGYAFVRYIHTTIEPWTVDEGLITPTLKLKRTAILKRFSAEIDRLYR